MANKTKNTKWAQFLLSTDTLWWYGLDIIFDLAQQAGFDGLDLATRKNFDARNPEYVAKLSKKYSIPVHIVQVSDKVNARELNQALELCTETWAKTITINAPRYFNLNSFNFLTDNLANYRKHNKDIAFSLINPPQSNFFALPIPKYRFTNMVEIIKKYGSFLALDIVNIDETALETDLLRKLSNFIPHLSTVYFSDKTRLGEWHILPGDGTLKLSTILKKLKKEWFDKHISLKIDIAKSDLADTDKVMLILKKATKYFEENYRSIDTH